MARNSYFLIHKMYAPFAKKQMGRFFLIPANCFAFLAAIRYNGHIS